VGKGGQGNLQTDRNINSKEKAYQKTRAKRRRKRVAAVAKRREAVVAKSPLHLQLPPQRLF